MNKTYLYHLSNGNTLSVFYIGITKFPKSRYAQHLTSAKNKRILNGEKLIMTIFSELDDDQNPRSAEKYIIVKAFELGIELINETLFNYGDYECDSILNDFIYSVDNISNLKSVDNFKFITKISESCLLITGEKRVRVQIVLTEYEDEQLKQEALEQGVSVSALIRRYIKEGLNKDEIKTYDIIEM